MKNGTTKARRWQSLALGCCFLAGYSWLWDATKAAPDDPAARQQATAAGEDSPLPAFGKLQCRHPYGDQMEDDLLCPLDPAAPSDHPRKTWASISLSHALALGWKVKQILPQGPALSSSNEPSLYVVLEKNLP